MCKATIKETIILDERTRINALDEETKAVYLGAPVSEHPNYDRSVFVEAIVDKTTKKKILFVPSAKRVEWFRTEYPKAVIVTDPPVFCGKCFSIEARVFMSLDDMMEGRMVARTQYNGYVSQSQDVDLNIACTRAKGRALRDLGYDLPRDAHEIPGWTRVNELEDGCKNPDAAESDVAVIVPVPLVPAENNEPKTKPNQTFEQHEGKAPVAANEAQESASQEEPVKEKSPARKKKTTATKTNAVPADEDSAYLPEAVVSEPEADSTVVSEPEEPKEMGDFGSNETAEPGSVQESAMQKFPNVADAENYQCRVLSGKTVGEQPDARIKYFAQKAINGERVIDPVLGLACVAVAMKRGLQI